MDLNKIQKVFQPKNYWQRVADWLWMPTHLNKNNPWQAIFIITHKLRSMVMFLIMLATIGTGITAIIFFYPLRLPQWLPVLHILLGLFFMALLLFIHFRLQGNHFYLKFLEEIQQYSNNQQTVKIPRDKRKILKQYEWYSQSQVLKANLIALGLATIFGLAPQKVVNALNPRKKSLTKTLEQHIFKQHQVIAHLKTINEQSKQMVAMNERSIQYHEKYIKRLNSDMYQHYRQVVELKRYLYHINRVGQKIRQLKRTGHSSLEQQEQMVRANPLVMGHIKGLMQAKLEQKEKPIKLADGLLKKYGATLQKFRELSGRYSKLKHKTNSFSYLNAKEIKKTKQRILEEQRFINDLQHSIEDRNQLIAHINKTIKADEQKLKYWKMRIEEER